ncbi:ferredoxin-type protein NapG [Rhodovibrionaceae bacterium A322]
MAPAVRNKQAKSRRDVLMDGARVACGVAAAGLGLFALAEQSKALPGPTLRPPGALPEGEFLSACLRCGLCVRDCPYDILSLADLGDGPAHGTPYFVARTGPCEMCDDIPCVVACPTGALTPSLTSIDESRMGIAVLTGRESCLNLKGLRCDVCYRVCPLIDQAIILERRHNDRTGAHAILEPVVLSDSCTGCGKCEQACVLEEAAIRVMPLNLVSNAHDSHYRYGWEEEEKAGGALVPDALDLPDRLPTFPSLGGES